MEIVVAMVTKIVKMLQKHMDPGLMCLAQGHICSFGANPPFYIVHVFSNVFITLLYFFFDFFSMFSKYRK